MTCTTLRSAPDRDAIREARRTRVSDSGPPDTATTTRSRASQVSVMFLSVRVLCQRGVDLIGQPQQRQLSQRGQVAGPEVVLHRRGGLLGRIDVAVSHPAPQRFRGDVDQFDLVGGADELVGHAFGLCGAGDMADHVVEALQVLDVDGGDHRDARVEEELHVLPAMGVAAARRVRMGEIVDEHDLRPPGQHRVDVEFGIPGALVLDVCRRDDLDARELLGGLAAGVRLDHRGNDIGAALHPAVRLPEHRIGLTHTGSRAQVDAQVCAFSAEDAHLTIIPRAVTPGSGIPSRLR